MLRKIFSQKEINKRIREVEEMRFGRDTASLVMPIMFIGNESQIMSLTDLFCYYAENFGLLTYVSEPSLVLSREIIKMSHVFNNGIIIENNTEENVPSGIIMIEKEDHKKDYVCRIGYSKEGLVIYIKEGIVHILPNKSCCKDGVYAESNLPEETLHHLCKWFKTEKFLEG